MQTQNIQLSEILDTIEEMGDLSESAMEAARARQEVLAKPTGALGRLEDISIQLAGITGKVKNNMQKQAIVIMSADNGVVSEGVASAPQSVTLSQTINFTRHLTGVSSMAKYFGIDLLVIDVGVKMPIPEALYAPEMTEHVCADVCCQTGLTQKIVNRRIADGTKNLAKEPAMTEDEAFRAIRTGMEAVEAIKRCGYDIFGVGEMGIGNTTTSACVLAALCGRSGAEVVGRGGGLNDEGLAKKIRIVDEATRGLDPADVLGILAKVGGFDIAGMTGLFLGGAALHMPVVADGFISCVAALCAIRMCPAVKDYVITSHKSKEPGTRMLLEAIDIPVFLDCDMCLGEGTGAVALFPFLDMGAKLYNTLSTFEDIHVEQYEELK